MRRGLQCFPWQSRKITLAPVVLVVCLVLTVPQNGGGQTLQTVNMAIPSKSFQMVIYPLAQQKGYMKEEGIDLRVIYIAPVNCTSPPSIAWMLVTGAI